MTLKIKSDYSQRFLFPPDLDDWVNEDDPARFICEFVDSIDLPEVGIKTSKPVTGRPCYDERMLLKIWIYGYFENIRSTRKLEKACHQQVPLLWLTGLNYPDHSTLSRFSVRNRKALKKLFKQVVKLAVKGNLVGMVVQATDGTKIAADVSKKKKLCKKDIELVLEVLDKQIGDYFSEIDKKEENWEYLLSGKLKNKEERKQWLEKELESLNKEEQLKIKERLEEELKEFEKADTNYLNKSDPDSRLMKCEGKSRFSYNAQATIDSNGIVTGENIVQSTVDYDELVKNLEESKENTGGMADENLADNGYFSSEQLCEADEKGYNVLVNIKMGSKVSNKDRNSEFHQCNFKYDKEEDCYICPREGKLKFERERKHGRKDHNVKLYRCQNYEDCPVRDKCSKDKEGRAIEISPYKKYIDMQFEKQKDHSILPEHIFKIIVTSLGAHYFVISQIKMNFNKALLKKRKHIIEPLFAWVKHIMGFRRWTWRGYENVKAQWSLICMTVNLKKIYKFWRKGEFKFA